MSAGPQETRLSVRVARGQAPCRLPERLSTILALNDRSHLTQPSDGSLRFGGRHGFKVHRRERLWYSLHYGLSMQGGIGQVGGGSP